MKAPNTTFQISQLDTVQILDLITSSVDTSDCLNNCSQNGQCTFSQSLNKFICDCDLFYSGSKCEIDIRPCSLNYCFNNGTCIQNLTDPASASYFCSCSKYYTGRLCETKLDICQNETCSNNGQCADINNTPKCVCFSSYKGDKCELMNDSLKLTKNFISIASSFAILFIVIFYLMFIVLDFSKLCIKTEKISIKDEKWNNKMLKKTYSKHKKAKKSNKNQISSTVLNLNREKTTQNFNNIENSY